MAALETFLKAMNKLSFSWCTILIYVYKNTEKKKDNMESNKSDLHVTLFITNIVNAGIFYAQQFIYRLCILNK